MSPTLERLPPSAADNLVTIVMPVYSLAKAMADEGIRVTKEAMTRRLGEWLMGARPNPPRGVATVAALMRALPSIGMSAELRFVPNCTMLAQARSIMAHQFQEAPGSNWLLHVDDDIGADAETCLELFRADSDVILCAYPQRLPPYVLTIHPLPTPDGKGFLPFADAPTRRTAATRRVIEIADGGLGLCLVRREVIAAVSRELAKTPRDYVFDGGKDAQGRRAQIVHIYREEILTLRDRRTLVGEDVAFMHRARALGARIECLADATVNHDGIVCSLGEILDSGALFTAADDEDVPTRADRRTLPASDEAVS